MTSLVNFVPFEHYKSGLFARRRMVISAFSECIHESSKTSVNLITLSKRWNIIPGAPTFVSVVGCNATFRFVRCKVRRAKFFQTLKIRWIWLRIRDVFALGCLVIWLYCHASNRFCFWILQHPMPPRTSVTSSIIKMQAFRRTDWMRQFQRTRHRT